MKVFQKVRRSALLTGNICKQIGVRKNIKLDVREFEKCWRKYVEYGSGLKTACGDRYMEKKQAITFMKHFSSALGEEYDDSASEIQFRE